jgi:hypothetical protein
MTGRFTIYGRLYTVACLKVAPFSAYLTKWFVSGGVAGGVGTYIFQNLNPLKINIFQIFFLDS